MVQNLIRLQGTYLVTDECDDLLQDENYYYLYKHCGIDSKLLSKKVIDECTWKFQKPLDFNDPYDCYFRLNTVFENFNIQTVSNFFERTISSSNWLKDKDSFKKHIDQMNCEKVNLFRKNNLVTCFNNSPLHMLMWSHYADMHKGLMFEFKFPKHSNMNEVLPIKVVYSDSIPILNLNWENVENNVFNESANEFAKKTILTKSQAWSYEKEYRLIRPLSECNVDNLTFRFDPEYLSSIIYGVKTDEKNILEFERSIKLFNKKNNTNLKSYRSTVSESKYEIEVCNHPRL